MVADIQGVGEILTDPVIHSKYYEFYGLGDQGTKGMLIFFMRHKCNPICEKLNLKKNRYQEKYKEMVFKETDTPLELVP
jgi:hypothetical protein